MRFWDTSALIPLCCHEQGSEAVDALLGGDDEVLVWWGTLVECASALARLEREAAFDDTALAQARARLGVLAQAWSEVLASEPLRDRALLLLRRHSLRAADALQLSAALTWAARGSGRAAFVCLDERLRRAASLEGFEVLP